MLVPTKITWWRLVLRYKGSELRERTHPRKRYKAAKEPTIRPGGHKGLGYKGRRGVLNSPLGGFAIDGPQQA